MSLVYLVIGFHQGLKKKCTFHRNIVTFPTISYVKSQNPPHCQISHKSHYQITIFPAMEFHFGKMRNLGSSIADKDWLVLGDTFWNCEGNCAFLFTKTHKFGEIFPPCFRRFKHFSTLVIKCKSIDNRIKNVFITWWIKIVDYFIYLLNKLQETNHRPDEVWTFE